MCIGELGDSAHRLLISKTDRGGGLGVTTPDRKESSMAIPHACMKKARFTVTGDLATNFHLPMLNVLQDFFSFSSSLCSAGSSITPCKNKTVFTTSKVRTASLSSSVNAVTKCPNRTPSGTLMVLTKRFGST